MHYVLHGAQHHDIWDLVITVFHEGLPGSGKSYEACVMHILPAWIESRAVLANINSINYKKFSDLIGIRCRLFKNFWCVFPMSILVMRNND
jgi:hypothetical protein